MVVVEVFVIVVLIAARSRYRDARTVIGIDGGGVVGGRRGDRDAVVCGAGESGHGGVFVAAGEDRQTSLDRTVGRACVMYEVLQRLLFERHAFLPLFLCLEARLAPFVAVGQSRNVAPAALQDHGAVVGGVFDRLDRGQRVAGRAARKNLARHDLRAGDAAPAAGDRADADAVVVLRGDYARHMRAVAGVVDVVP